MAHSEGRVPSERDATGELALDREKQESATLKRKLEVSERDLRAANDQIIHLKSGRELRLSQMLHKRDSGILGDADKLLHSLDSHLVQILSEIEEVAGAERRRELEESVRQEVAAYKRRRKHHVKQCELRMRNVSGEPDSE